jgi:AhpD family alkylhydroperoxidase
MGNSGLTPDQQELVAIGASVGAGCHPCFNYHAKAGNDAGVSVDRLRSALGSAERVATEAAGKMSGHIRAHLAFSPTGSAPHPFDDVLAGLGAALGANDRTNIEAFVQSAAALGATREQIQHAIKVAQSTQESAMRLHRRAADRAVTEIFGAEPSPAGDAAPEETGCGCQAETAEEPALA